MVKMLAKPIYNWVINTDNDPVMEKLTNRMRLNFADIMRNTKSPVMPNKGTVLLSGIP